MTGGSALVCAMHRTRIMKVMSAAIVVVLTACAQQAAFTPTENVGARGAEDQPAAVYQVRSSPDQNPYADVSVWSRGAESEDGRTVVDLTVAVTNTGDRPVELVREGLILELFDDEGRAMRQPEVLRGPDPRLLVIPPGQRRDIPLRYGIPADIGATNIESLRFRWALARPGEKEYVQFTDFRQNPEPMYVGGWWGYYDPFWGPYPYGYYGYGYYPRASTGRVIVSQRPTR